MKQKCRYVCGGAGALLAAVAVKGDNNANEIFIGLTDEIKVKKSKS